MNDINLGVPFFSQRNNYYKWENSQDKKKCFYLAAVSCNITSLCMILNYLGITDDTPTIFSKKVFEKYKNWNKELNGYDSLTLWSNLEKIAYEIYGIDKLYVKSLTSTIVKNSIDYLKNGFPIIFSIGTLSKNTSTGHIVVLRGFVNNKYYVINDPWGDPTNPFGELENSKDKVKGFYVARKDIKDVLFGKGSGDNCLLSEEAFKLSTGYSSKENLLFNGALVIKYPFIYSFPLNKNLKFGLTKLYDIYDEYNNNYRYLLADNGRLLRGMEFVNLNTTSVYSCGPGRIIAARNCKNIEKNFILIQYPVPKSDGKFFYVNYKRLDYIDVAKIIKERLYEKKEDENSLINQLINKIKPKKVVFDKGSVTGDVLDSLGLPERGYTYLVPINENLKNYIYDIDNNSNKAFDVNDINNYKIVENNNTYYLINNKRVLADKLIPQTINFNEYNYYRAKLRDLKNAKITFFCDEDYKKYEKKKEFVNKENYKKYFLSALKDIFYTIDFSCSSYENALKNVENHYIKLIKTSKTNKLWKKNWNDFYERSKSLCKTLLEIPWKEQEWAFSLNDKWFRGGNIVNKKGKIIGKFDCLADIYENVRRCYTNVQSQSEIKINSWNEFVKEVFLFYPSNVDYYLEVTSQTLLGTCSSKIEIECFSEENLLENSTEIKIDSLSKDYVVKKLKDSSIISDKNFSIQEDYLTDSDVIDFNKNDVINLSKIVLKLKNPFTKKFTNEFDKNLEKLKGISYADKDLKNDFKLENIFPSKVFELIYSFFMMKSDKKDYFYYNILNFLEEMTKKQGE